MNIVKIVAFRIKELRTYRKLSQEAMAAEFDLVVKSYANMENGVTDLKLSNLKKLADLLNVDLHDLLNVTKPIEELMYESITKKKTPTPPPSNKDKMNKMISVF